MKNLNWRILCLALVMLMTTTAGNVRGDKVKNNTRETEVTEATPDQEEVSTNATDDTEKERATRSLGKISKLLFGGTYVMVQLGQMPPDHPLVKYPVPVQAAGSANIGKVIAAVPGMNGRKSDLSYLPHAAGLPPPIAAATSSLSYNELQDMYEPMVHKPYVPPEHIKPLTPSVTHLPGTFYSEKDDGKPSVVPLSPYSSHESSAADGSYGSAFGKDFYGSSSPTEYETTIMRDPATGQSSAIRTTYQQNQPLAHMASVLKYPQSTVVRHNHHSILKHSQSDPAGVIQQQQEQVIYQSVLPAGSFNNIAYPTVLYAGKPPKSKGHGLKFPRITDFLFSTMNGRSKPRLYPTENPQSQSPVYTVLDNGVSGPNPANTVVSTSPEYSPTKTQDTSAYQYASTQAYYPPSSQSYAQNQYYHSPSPTPSQKYQETVYAQPYSQPEIQYMPPPPVGNNNEQDNPHSPSPSYDGQQGSSHYHVQSPTPTPTYSPYDPSHSQRHSSSHDNSQYYQHPTRPTSKPAHTTGPPLRVYYPKEGSTPPPKYSKYDSKYPKDYPQSYYKQKDHAHHSHHSHGHKHQDYSASASHDVHHASEGYDNYPPIRSSSDSGHKKHKNHEGPQEYAYFPVDSGYAFTTYPPPSENHNSKASEYAPVQYASHNSQDYSGAGYRPSQIYVNRESDAGQYDTSTEYSEPSPHPSTDYTRDSAPHPGAHTDGHYPRDSASVDYSRGPPPPGAPVSPPTALPTVEIEYPRQIPSIPVRVEHVHEPSRHYPQNYPERPPFNPPGSFDRFQQKDVIPEPLRSSSHRHKSPKTTHRVEHIYHNSPNESPYFNENVDNNFLKRSQDGSSKHRSSSSSSSGKSHHHHSSKYSSSKSHKKGSKSKSGSSYYSSRHEKGYHRPSSKSSSNHRYSSKGKHSSSRHHSSRRDEVYYTPREFYETLKRYYEDRGYYDRPSPSFSTRTLKVVDASSKGKGSSSSSSRSKQEKSSRYSSSNRREQESPKEKVSEVIVLKRKDPTVLVPREPLHERQPQVVSSNTQQYSTQSTYQQAPQGAFQPQSVQMALSPQLSAPSNTQQPTNLPQHSTSQFTSPASSNIPQSSATAQSSSAYSKSENQENFSQVHPPVLHQNPANNPANAIPVNTYPTATTYPSRSSLVTPAAFSAPSQKPINSYSSSSNADTIVPHASIEAIVKALDVFK